MNRNRNVLILLIQKLYLNHISTIERSRQRFLRNIIAADNAFMERRRRRIIFELNKKKKVKVSRKLLHSSEWWLNIVSSNYTDSAVFKKLRMERETFLYIVDRLKDAIKPSEKAFLSCLSVEKMVAITLFKLASCTEYQVVAKIFGVHKTSVQRCLYKVCKAINNILLEEEIYMPKEMEEVKRIAQEFEKKCKFSPVIGVIDSTHIPILAPSVGYRDYVNRKHWPSLVLQVVVDPFLCFRYVNAGQPGSVNDATVLKDSDLYKNHENLIPKCHDMSSFLIGDATYPLLPWLIKGYNPPKTTEEQSFNVYLNSGRIVTEQAIERLKARWRCLCKRIDVNYKFIPQVITACCVLHNLVERRNENFEETWLDEAKIDQESYPQPPRTPCNSFFSLDGDAIREKIKTYLNETQPLRKLST